MASSTPTPASKNPPVGPPKSTLESIIFSTPVVLTVFATVLAGLSSSEMSGGQYYRSLASQMQSKAGDQWSFFQAKKLRGSANENTLAILQGFTQPGVPDLQEMRRAASHLISRIQQVIDLNAHTSSASGTDADAMTRQLTKELQQARSLLENMKVAATQPAILDSFARLADPEIAEVMDHPIDDPKINAVLHGMDSNQSEIELEQLSGQIDETNLQHAMDVASANFASFDAASDRLSQSTDAASKIGQKLVACAASFQTSCRQILSGNDAVASSQPSADSNAAAANITRALSQTRDDLAQLNADFTTARLKADNARYKGEAARNQTLAKLYEVQVRKESFSSERHRLRSKQFFYGMLAAQAGVTIATLSLAVKRRSLLWSLAAGAGLFAVAFGGYVYLFI